MSRKQTLSSLCIAILSLALIAAVTIDAACTPGTWTEVASLGGSPPTNLADLTLAAYPTGNLLYSFGGGSRNYTASSNVYSSVLLSFNPTTQLWTALSSTGGPAARAYHASVVSTFGGSPKLLVLGGTSTIGGSRTTYRDFWSWNIQTGGWTQLANFPTLIVSPGLAYHNGRVYAFGGVYNAIYSISNVLYAYDIATNAWSTLTALNAVGSPSKRHGPALFASGGNLYVSGGMDYLAGTSPVRPPPTVPLSDTWMFNLTSATWSNITPSSANNMLPAASFPAYGASGSSIVLYGGDTGASVSGLTGCNAPYPQQITDETWVGTVSGTVVAYAKQTPATRPPAFTQGAGAVLGSCLYVLGGFGFPSCPPGQIWNNKLYAYGF